MQYIKGINTYHNTNRTAITLGKFDGLHLGHETLISQIIAHQEKDGVDSIVFAFDMAQPNNLMTNEERAAKLEGRVDYLVECPFDQSISHMEAETFITQILVEKFAVKYLVVGTDFRFGYQKKGDYQTLIDYAKRYDYQVEVIEKKRYQDVEISSTYIKEELKQGNMAFVNTLLGYPYTITGEVITGRQLGRTIGIPTMNIRPQKEKLLPPNGVYASKILIDDVYYTGISNIGKKPTVVNEGDVLLETHVFDFTADTYGKTIAVSLYDYQRPEQKFTSVDELQRTMNEDIKYSKKYFDTIENI